MRIRLCLSLLGPAVVLLSRISSAQSETAGGSNDAPATADVAPVELESNTAAGFPEASHSPAAPAWSVGVGIALFNYAFLSVDDFDAGHSAFNWRPSLLFLVERRLSPLRRLIVDVSGSYLRREQESMFVTGSLTEVTDLAQISLGVGLRRVFNPGKNVEVSGFVIGGFGWSHAKRTFPGLNIVTDFDPNLPPSRKPLESKYNALFGSIYLGMAVEKLLTEDLLLRFQSTLLTVDVERRYCRGPMALDTDTLGFLTEPVGDAEATFFTSGISITPSIQLLLTF